MLTPPLFHPPDLATLHTRPSWVNLAGRVDRSACFHLRASEIWRTIPAHHWQPLRTPEAHRRSQWVPPHRLARANCQLYDFVLQQLHNRRQPRRLSGDFRSAKANAMKLHDQHFQPLPPTALKTLRNTYPGPDQNLHPNPNQGASCTKHLGLTPQKPMPPEHGWSQHLTLERWQLNPILTTHYLICPHCPRKCKMLFLPLATQPELRDAALAHRWLTQNSDTIARTPALHTLANQLTARYSLLFPPRRLQCQHCLHLRFGTGSRQKRGVGAGVRV